MAESIPVLRMIILGLRSQVLAQVAHASSRRRDMHVPPTWCALLVVALVSTGCTCWTPSLGESVPASNDSSAISHYTYEVVAKLPHDPNACTEGLVFRDGIFLESTGIRGHSSLRALDPATGRILKCRALPPNYFGEGLAVIGNKAFQLTFDSGKALIYDADTLQLEKVSPFEGEAWGLATDGRELILSDGTSRIRFLDPATFAVTRCIIVKMENRPVEDLNELEFIKGEIFANRDDPTRNEIIRIDPTTGRVLGVINFDGLLSKEERENYDTDAFNGIAFDAETDRLFVTGKWWPWIFQVRLKPVP